MSGIPVYTASPINSAKVAGVTPQTQTEPSRTGPPGPAAAPVTTTATSSYVPAQPGASVPAPTGTSQRYAPVQATPTRTSDFGSPPPPQPGSVPKSNIAPPPRAAEKYNRPQAQPMPQPYPPQMAIPPPISSHRAQPPSSSTATSTVRSSAYPIQLPSGGEDGSRRSLEHPPGYHQNTYASELSSDQRRANDSSNSGESSEGIISSLDAGQAWNTAKSWLGTAGNKLSEAEKEVWRKLGKE